MRAFRINLRNPRFSRSHHQVPGGIPQLAFARELSKMCSPGSCGSARALGVRHFSRRGGCEWAAPVEARWCPTTGDGRTEAGIARRTRWVRAHLPIDAARDGNPTARDQPPTASRAFARAGRRRRRENVGGADARQVAERARPERAHHYAGTPDVPARVSIPPTTRPDPVVAVVASPRADPSLPASFEKGAFFSESRQS